MIVAPAEKQVRVAFTGPVQTNLSINSRLLVERDLGAVQDRLVHTLTSSGVGPDGGAWRRPEAVEAARMERDIDNRRGRTVLPYFVVGWHCTGDEVCWRQLGEIQRRVFVDTKQRDAGASLGTFAPKTLDVRINHFGFGSVTLQGLVTPNRDLDAPALRRCVEQFSSDLSKTDAFIDALSQVVDAARGALHEMSRDDDEEEWLTASDTVFRDPAHGSGKTVDLFWFHRVFGLEWPEADPDDAFTSSAHQLVFEGRARQVAERTMRDDSTYLIGEGNSVAIARPQTEEDTVGTGVEAQGDCVDLLVDLIRMHNVYYAAATRLDKRLFQIGNRIILNSDRKDMGSLEENADLIVDYYERASFFEAVYRDYEDHLDTDSHAIWDCIAQAWATRDKFEAIERKLSYLEKIYDRAMKSITHLQNQRLNTIVLVFTFLSLGSVAVDMASYVYSEAEAPDRWNWSNLYVMSRVLLGLLTVIVVGYVLFRQFDLSRARLGRQPRALLMRCRRAARRLRPGGNTN